MRDVNTPTALFRQLLREIGLLLAYEVCHDLETEEVDIQTPLEVAKMPKLEGKKLCFISILRAGNGLLDGMLDLVPSARVGHVGLYRDPETLVPVEYISNCRKTCPIVSALLLTRCWQQAIRCGSCSTDQGNRCKAINCLCSAPGSRLVYQRPTCRSCRLDRELNDPLYSAGLGDAGDRMYGQITGWR